ncbi:hypothetical protein [Pinibacter soli]|uniref:Uncharacterized protein n=1 Tax=Pinibacter soli TaxID=3044211 RepID=A0ABT6R9K7_9BACT|nr:hypothetical protein [Pinibacter soli]MDI3318572.1 hypothetical protein [Pinibacter soli]
MIKRILTFSFIFSVLLLACACNGAVDKKNDEATTATTAASTDKYDKKRKEGIDFVASGDQPTWEMDIDMQKAIWFTALEENVTALNTPVPAAVKNGDTTIYQATVDAGSIKVIIINQPCINSATGEVADHSVEVQTSGKVFKGCGKYLN